MPNPFTSEELAALEADASTPPRAAVTAAVITKDLEARKAKLLRKAPFIRDAVQLDDILESFPAEHRAELREKVKGLVKSVPDLLRGPSSALSGHCKACP